MSDTTLDDTFVALCDWHGHLVWTSKSKSLLQAGEFVWTRLAEGSQETMKATLARVVTLREQQILEIQNELGQQFRVWLWPLESPAIAVCVLGMRIPGEISLLAQRELDCLRLLAQGHSTNSIASDLDISVSTVHTHLRRAREKLELTSSEALIGFAARYCRPPGSLSGDIDMPEINIS